MTTRPLSSALATEIQQPVVRPVLLYEGEFASPGSETPSFLRLWSGVGDLSWDGKTWTGAGHLLGLSPLGENTELRAEGFTVSLAGMTTEAVSRALQEVRQGKPGKLWIGAMRAEAYLELPGVTGNYASTPDSAALGITGDIDLRVKFRWSDWTPATISYFFSQYLSLANGSWLCSVAGVSTGRLNFEWVDSGGTLRSVQSTASPSVSDGQDIWLRFTLDVDNGSGGHVATFYTSADRISWTQLGATRNAGAFTTSIKDSTSPVNFGAAFGATGPATALGSGRGYYAEIRNGIDGTVVAKFDPRRFTAGQSTAVMETGETWTINTSGGTPARIVPAGEVLVGDPYLIQEGRFDIASLEDPGNGPCVISAAYEGELIDLDRPRERRWTPEDQALDYPGDQGFDQVAQLQDASFVWGR